MKFQHSAHISFTGETVMPHQFSFLPYHQGREEGWCMDCSVKTTTSQRDVSTISPSYQQVGSSYPIETQ
jgi:hypothetical protein